MQTNDPLGCTVWPKCEGWHVIACCSRSIVKSLSKSQLVKASGANLAATATQNQRFRPCLKRTDSHDIALRSNVGQPRSEAVRITSQHLSLRPTRDAALLIDSDQIRRCAGVAKRICATEAADANRQSTSHGFSRSPRALVWVNPSLAEVERIGCAPSVVSSVF